MTWQVQQQRCERRAEATATGDIPRVERLGFRGYLGFGFLITRVWGLGS